MLRFLLIPEKFNKRWSSSLKVLHLLLQYRMGGHFRVEGEGGLPVVDVFSQAALGR